MNLGTQIFDSEFQILWGNKNASVSNIQSAFPSCSIVKLHQTHSDTVRTHTASHSVHGLEGDAIISKLKTVAFLISTADCQPVIVVQPETGWMAAIHAGWRGVASQIVVKAVQNLIKESGSPQGLKLWIGPHIQMESFEAGNDVRDLIMNSISSSTQASKFYQKISCEKSLIDLSSIVLEQLRVAGLQMSSIWISPEDTVTDQRYHSHRRDREKSGRQHSFILARPLAK